MNTEKYLPMGTIVILNKGFKKIMIFGRKQKKADTGELFDYIAYLYPEGNIKQDLAILFNHEDIKEIVHVGYIDEDEEKFQKLFLKAEEIANEKDIFNFPE